MKAGDTFETTRSGTLEVLAYHDSRRVRVRFLETGYTMTTTAQNVRTGKVLDRKMMLDKNLASLNKEKAPKYSIELNTGETFEGRTYQELAEQANVSVDLIKSVATNRIKSPTIISFTRL